MPKIVPKSIQTCFEHVLGQTFRKIFAQFSMECRVFENFQKKNNFKIPKMPKSVPKCIQTCFSVIFTKIFYAQCSMEGRVFENFQIFFSKFQKRPKSFPKESKRVLIVIWDNFFEKFLPSFPWKVESSKIFKKIKKLANFLKCPKSFSKVSKRVLNVFWGKLFEKFLPSFPWNVESSKIFTKKCFQNSKNAQKCSQKYPNVF